MRIINGDVPSQRGIDVVYALIGIICGAAVGITFADIDLQVPEWLLHHRALFTHGIIVPLVLLWWSRRTHHHALRGFTLGFCVTNAIHLSFDLFPRAWWGHALIHIFMWALPPIVSWVWIALSIMLCLYLARSIIQTIWDMFVAGIGIIAGFTVYAHEGLIFPFFAFVIAGIIAFMLPYPFRIRREKYMRNA
jgi:hypothetical protein